MQMTATYSAEDDKLRLYPAARLDAETYGKVKAAGFTWAPKQELFVQVWTPEREDVARGLAGEIDDEEMSRSERAEERAERFETYSEKRAEDAEAARDAVARIADGIPFGQPILVGHHSERHARRDAKRIEAGMHRAVENWKTSEYWTRRAAGVTSHAARMERPDVRARRVKTLEADLRKHQRNAEKAGLFLKLWSSPGLTIDQARKLANVAGCAYLRVGGSSWSAWDLLQPDETRFSACPSLPLAEIIERVCKIQKGSANYSERWIAHLSNRLTFERAMLAASGWEEPVKPKSLKATLPLLNYSGAVAVRNRYRDTVETYEAHPMTKADYAKIHADYKGTRISACGTHKVRTAIVRGGLVVVFLTDSKAHPIPDAAEKEKAEARDAASAEALMRTKLERLERMRAARDARAAVPVDEKAATFAAMAKSLREGVAVVSVPQLFPTPALVADRMVELAEIGETDRVLEPSAGTGAILDAIRRGAPRTAECLAVEINADLANRLETRHAADSVVRGDFLAWGKGLGTFERVVMNPPFGDAADISHVRHALTLLAPGGRLVALCAAGPRQEAALRPLASSWETLDAGTFAGTNVRAALLVIDKPTEVQA